MSLYPGTQFTVDSYAVDRLFVIFRRLIAIFEMVSLQCSDLMVVWLSEYIKTGLDIIPELSYHEATSIIAVSLA